MSDERDGGDEMDEFEQEQLGAPATLSRAQHALILQAHEDLKNARDAKRALSAVAVLLYFGSHIHPVDLEVAADRAWAIATRRPGRPKNEELANAVAFGRAIGRRRHEIIALIASRFGITGEAAAKAVDRVKKRGT